MISFNKLGKLGRLGNALFQIASTCGIAKSLGTNAVFPIWSYQKYFKNQLPRKYTRFPEINEPHFHYSNDWFQDNSDYGQWLQSEKYFESKEAVKKIFEWDVTFKELVKSKYATALSKPTIAVSIRRGDFVGNGNYELIPAEFYVGALLKFDYKNYNVLFFSDDMSYCKTHFQCIDPFFIDADPIEQLCLMTLCENHIISNSTFSWWGAYLSESKRVIRPAYNFSPKYIMVGNYDRDYWAKGWEVYDHKNEKIKLDCTFTIPVQYDHLDRKENLKLVLNSLSVFDCGIIVGVNDFGGTEKIEGTMTFRYPFFHRTKMLNEMAKKCKGVIVNYDADVLVPPMQIILAVELIKQGADMVYPYDGRFARVPRKWYSEILKYNDIGIISKYTFDGMRAHELRSYGGAVFFNVESFFKGGGENEKYISYAPEDFDRFYRFTTLGFKVERVGGVLYHFDHFVGSDSYIHHPHYQANLSEYDKLNKMSKEELKSYYGLDSSL